jgi:hypothetical protein
MCTVNQDGRTVELARTASQLEERSSGHSKMLLIPRIYVENIWGLISPNIKKMQILSSTVLLHNNRDKDGINNNNGQIPKVST